jgi:hypothetical protein
MRLIHGTQRIITIRRKTSVLMAVIGLVLSFVLSNGWRYLVSNLKVGWLNTAIVRYKSGCTKIADAKAQTLREQFIVYGDTQ